MMVEMLDEPSPPPELPWAICFRRALRTFLKATGATQWRQRSGPIQISCLSSMAWVSAGSGTWSEFSSLGGLSPRPGSRLQFRKLQAGHSTASFHLGLSKPLTGVASRQSSNCAQLPATICSSSKPWDLRSFGRLSACSHESFTKRCSYGNSLHQTRVDPAHWHTVIFMREIAKPTHWRLTLRARRSMMCP